MRESSQAHALMEGLNPATAAEEAHVQHEAALAGRGIAEKGIPTMYMSSSDFNPCSSNSVWCAVSARCTSRPQTTCKGIASKSGSLCNEGWTKTLCKASTFSSSVTSLAKWE